MINLSVRIDSFILKMQNLKLLRRCLPQWRWCDSAPPSLHLLITHKQLGFLDFFTLVSLSRLICQSSFSVSAKKFVAWWPNGVQPSNSPFWLWLMVRLWSRWRGRSLWRTWNGTPLSPLQLSLCSCFSCSRAVQLPNAPPKSESQGLGKG